MKRIISISKTIARDLALRENADLFFQKVQSYPQNEIVIDFTDVKSISRSFAHEYLSRKRMSNKTIKEIKVPYNIQKMFDIVQKPNQRAKELDLDSLQVITL